jgi:hypothetical protein
MIWLSTLILASRTHAPLSWVLYLSAGLSFLIWLPGRLGLLIDNWRGFVNSKLRVNNVLGLDRRRATWDRREIASPVPVDRRSGRGRRQIDSLRGLALTR